MSLNEASLYRNEGVLASIVPFLASELTPFSAYTWNYSTVPQNGLDDRVLAYARGRMLGGSSSMIMHYAQLPIFLDYTEPSGSV